MSVVCPNLYPINATNVEVWLFLYVTTLADCACAFELFHDARRTNDVNARLYKASRAETRFRFELLLSEKKVDFAIHRHFDV